MQNGVSRTTVLLVASLASFLTPFMGSSINIALPSIGAEFASDAVLLSWVPTAYLLSSAIFIVPFGRLADIHGKVKIFSWGIVLYTLGSLLSALAPTVIVLIAVRLLQGVGAAMIYGTGVALITTVFPAEERGKALGINVAAVYLGLSLGPFIGGALTQQWGWRSIFLANVLCGAVIIFFVATRLKSDRHDNHEPFDATGSVIYGGMLLCLMYGFSILPASMGFLLIAAGIAGFFAFMEWEKRIEHPVLDIRLFTKNRVFAFSNLAALINYSATFAIAFLISLYLQYIKGFDPLTAGLVLIAQPVVQTIFSPPAGRLSDRIEPSVIASAGMAVCSVALLLFATLDADSALAFIIATEMLVGVGFALFSSPNTNAVMSAVAPRQYGVASGTLASMRLIGMMFSMGLVMLLFSLLIGRVEITPEFYPAFLISMKAAFVLFAVLCGIGTVTSYQRGKVRQ
ncbi:MAG: MFS transporter [Methanomicrobiaceae archaeon]|nr:MFS transporter [Methanomicrobiaceae archaeon]